MTDKQRIFIKRSAMLILVLMTAYRAISQVGINTEGLLPDNSAMLDVRSTSKGILFPRLSQAQRQAIPLPASGLTVFDTDQGRLFGNRGTPAAPSWTFLASPWNTSGTRLFYTAGNVGIGVNNPAQRLIVGGKIAAAYGSAVSAAYRFGSGTENTGFSSPAIASIAVVTSGVTRVFADATGRIGISSGSPAATAQLEVVSITRGFLPPRMTTAQRNTIANPAAGLMIYNTDEDEMNIYRNSGWGTVVIHPCGQPFTDPRDGKVYTTILIGSQCWMRENMNLGTRLNTTVAPSDNGIIEKHCYNDLESNCTEYGGLYAWEEMMQYAASSENNPSGVQGICPTGWHIASDAEWCQLELFLDATISCTVTGDRGTTVGGQMKEAGLAHWTTPNTGATNSSGFTALPAGYRDGFSGDYTYQNTRALFWSSTLGPPLFFPTGWTRSFHYNNTLSGRGSTYIFSGLSVRCVRN